MTTAARSDNFTPSEKSTFAAKIAEMQFGAPHRMQSVAPILAVAPARLAPAQPATPDLPHAIRLKSVDLQRRLHLLVAHVNRTLPVGCHVLAWSILPKELFEGELGRFLMIACDFHACGPENTLLLPAAPGGMQYLNLPRHPLTTADAHIADAAQRVGQLRQTVTADHERTSNALRNGDLSQIFESGERQLRYRRELAAIARQIAETAHGPSIWDEHESRFRKLLQSL
jgi:hypothetical protein